MRVLLHHDLDPAKINGFAKWQQLIAADDLKSADVKKIGDNLYRARLNRSDRLLLAFYQHQGERYAAVLEYLPNHNYAASRFLRGVAVPDENKLMPVVEPPQALPSLAYINPQHGRFHFLDKLVSLDAEQQDIYQAGLPLVLIGPAGSGKTVLLLEKLKQQAGEVLYVTLSPYLAQNARSLYYAHGYANPAQAVDFLAFDELLASIQMPTGKPLPFPAFAAWVSRQRSPIKDAYKLFEEFRGVLTGMEVAVPYLGREQYMALGARQSVFMAEERPLVYDLFTRYLAWLNEQGWYDTNLLSHHHLAHAAPRYDAVVVDEVQDCTNIQLCLILKLLRQPAHFMLCGDAHQVVHPNFFSWGRLKSWFFKQSGLAVDTGILRILYTNYRNAQQVTELANRILRLKRARFGSLDRESHYLVRSSSTLAGKVWLLPDQQAVRAELDSKTRRSTKFAVVVLQAEHKAAAQQYFGTPLVFSIHEAKGLEYENVILYNLVSAASGRFRAVCEGVDAAALQGEWKYARAKDKADKTLETYKFYINGLYVALTRAVSNLYWVEAETQHPLLVLLGLHAIQGGLELTVQQSSVEEWQYEARKLEQQGKQEQAERIRRDVLQQQLPTWPVFSGQALASLVHQALQGHDKAARLALFEVALANDDRRLLRTLAEQGFKPALHLANGIRLLQQKYCQPYQSKHLTLLRQQLDRYGVDFRNPCNQTPLMLAAWVGNAAAVRELVQRGANLHLVDNLGHTALHWALGQAVLNPKYARQYLGEVYRLLAPPTLNVQVEGRFQQLDWQSPEYLLLHLMVAAFHRLLPGCLVAGGKLFNAPDLAAWMQHFPPEVLSEQRKRREYWSAILAKHAMHGQDKGNRKLFWRFRQGQYLFNPTLLWQVDGEWVNIYDLLRLANLVNFPLPARAKEAGQAWEDAELARHVALVETQLQQERTALLHDALLLLKQLCEQELRKIQVIPQ